ncbi:beta-phosphoglucomutase family hydrolase [Tessaracoccus sp. OS52]|uniref:HAD family hydrolase n=1 Tax=Tessaracoccus sp. OS52 TaxID=2886691 RepID=UPI001D11B7EB|nr:beta-phosphoglucomutase family hydrolase [Tessaracoccus sp. OS52]MCC2592462.1 beta-phosphoglucomutase family hydrolase [Tessaracoccus sp. OS52]
MDLGSYSAYLFDLDGVITPTAKVHMLAWSEMFNGFLATLDGQLPYTDDDYFRFVDGKPRYDGVRDFLISRGIALPEGASADAPTELTVRGLGNRKNEVFNQIIDRDGVEAYPGSVALIRQLVDVGAKLAVVSSSKNTPSILRAAGLAEFFPVVVDGNVARDLALPGKPAPDTFLHAARELGVEAPDAVVFEDAISGVMAASAGGFGLVVGVDRGVGRDPLVAAGAALVVQDLAELVVA